MNVLPSGIDRRCIVHLAFDPTQIEALNALLRLLISIGALVGPVEKIQRHVAQPTRCGLPDAVFIHRLKGENLKWLERIPPHLPVIGIKREMTTNLSSTHSIYAPSILCTIPWQNEHCQRRIVFEAREKGLFPHVNVWSPPPRGKTPFFGVFSTPPQTYRLIV